MEQQTSMEKYHEKTNEQPKKGWQKKKQTEKKKWSFWIAVKKDDLLYYSFQQQNSNITYSLSYIKVKLSHTHTK